MAFRHFAGACCGRGARYTVKHQNKKQFDTSSHLAVVTSLQGETLVVGGGGGVSTSAGKRVSTTFASDWLKTTVGSDWLGPVARVFVNQSRNRSHKHKIQRKITNKKVTFS